MGFLLQTLTSWGEDSNPYQKIGWITEWIVIFNSPFNFRAQSHLSCLGLCLTKLLWSCLNQGVSFIRWSHSSLMINSTFQTSVENIDLHTGLTWHHQDILINYFFWIIEYFVFSNYIPFISGLIGGPYGPSKIRSRRQEPSSLQNDS